MSMICTSYAQALYDLARDEGVDERILEELETLSEVFSAEPEFLRLLASPNLSKDERCGVVDKTLCDRVHPYVRNAIKLLTQKGIVREFCNCAAHYRKLYDVHHGILAVTAVTALPLSAEQSQRLTGKLASITGKTIRLHNRVDPNCIGGVRLDYDGKRLDGTVESRLASLRELMKNTIL